MPGESSTLPGRFRYRLSPVDMRRGLWLVLVSILILTGLGILVSESPAETILDDLQRQPAWALALAVAGIAALSFLVARIVSRARDAWLVVDSEGIRCSPHPHHGPRNWLRHDWQLPWSAIDKAVVQRPGPKAAQVQNWINTTLTLESEQGRHDLALLLWDPVDEALDRPDLMAFRPGKRLHALTESHPLIRHLEQRGIEVEYRPLDLRGRWGLGKPAADRPDADAKAAPVDLLRHRSLVIMLCLMGLLGLAAALHFTVMPPIRPLWSPSYGLLALAGSVVFVAAAILSGTAPARERLVVALMLGLSVGLLAHPLSARLMSATGEQPVTADYIVEGPGRFQPLDAAYPALDLSDLNVAEYWNALPDGELHPFDLQAVGDGRFILRLEPLYERTRHFYARSQGE